jgi:hypothetical protein
VTSGRNRGVVHPPLRLIGVELGGHDIEVARQHYGRPAGEKRLGMAGKPLKPSQLEIELRTGCYEIGLPSKLKNWENRLLAF